MRFHGGLVSKAHKLLYHPTLGSRVIKKKKTLGEETRLQRSVQVVIPAGAWNREHL